MAGDFKQYKYVCNVISTLLKLSIMATLRIYREKICYLSSNEVVQQRREIFRTLNGDVFFPLKRWPEDARLLFWKKTHWGQGNLQAVAVLSWKRLLSRPYLSLDTAVPGLDNT